MYILDEYYSDLVLNNKKILAFYNDVSIQQREGGIRGDVILSTRPGIYNCISFSLISKKEY
jgi:hypothetical protein